MRKFLRAYLRKRRIIAAAELAAARRSAAEEGRRMVEAHQYESKIRSDAVWQSVECALLMAQGPSARDLHFLRIEALKSALLANGWRPPEWTEAPNKEQA